MTLSLREIQEEHQAWAWYNFPDTPVHRPLMGAAEDLGELMHAQLRGEQGTREAKEPHPDLLAKDAIGALILFLVHYCNLRGFDLEEIVDDTWAIVRHRDRVKFPKNGRTA